MLFECLSIIFLDNNLAQLRHNKTKYSHILITCSLQKNMCILPDDLKSFYLTTNGLLIQWCIKFDGICYIYSIIIIILMVHQSFLLKPKIAHSVYSTL